jgi:ABC-2 type transport system ATP-binding protein
MDEPTAGLDEAAFRATWEHLKTAQSERQLTVLLTTHRPEEAERCDRIAVLQNGAVSVVDTPAALQAQVSSDVVVITAQEPALLQQAISDRFSVPTLLEGAEILVECERGHEWIPRLVEAFPDGRIATIGLRRPSLGDVFLKMTGASLQGAP